MVRLSEIAPVRTEPNIPLSMSLSEFNNLAFIDQPIVNEEDTDNPGILESVGIGIEKGLGGTPSEVGKIVHYFGKFIRNNQKTVFGTKPLFPTEKLGERISNAGLRIYFSNESALAKKFPQKEGEEQEFNFPEALGQGVVSLGAALGLSVLLGPAAAGVAFGVSAKTRGFLEAERKGKTFKQADEISSMLGVAEGSLEFVGINALLKSSGGILTRAAKGYITEFTQELSQEVAGGTIRFANGLREFDGVESLKEIMVEGLQAGSVGGILGSSVSIPISIAQKAGIKQGFIEMGATPDEAGAAADEVMKRGMDDVMAAFEEIEQEMVKKGPIDVAGLPPSETFTGTEQAQDFGEGITEDVEAQGSLLKQLLEQKERVAELLAKTELTSDEEVEASDLTQQISLGTEALVVATGKPKAELQQELTDETQRRITERAQEQQAKAEKAVVKKQEKAERSVREASFKIEEARAKFKKAIPQTKAEVKAVQESIIKELQNSELEAADKAKFIAKIKNTQTAKQFERVLPEIQERIAKLETAVAKRGLIQRFKKLTTKQQVNKLRPEFKAPVQQVIDEVTAVKPSNKKLTRLKKLAEFIEKEPDNVIPQNKLNELKLLSQKPLSDMTVSELDNVITSVQHFIKLNTLKQKIIDGRKIKDFVKVRDEAVENVQLQTDKLDDSIDGLDVFQQDKENKVYARVKRFLFGSDSLNAEFKGEHLDNKDKGVIWRILYKRVSEGVERQLQVQHEAEDFFTQQVGDVQFDRWSTSFVKLTKRDLTSSERLAKKVDVVTAELSDGRTIRMTKAERVAFLLHSRNVQNRKHLLEGGFSFPLTPQKINKLTEGDIETILSEITNDEIRLATAISTYLNTIQKDNINEVSVDLLGKEIATEINYFPIRTNFLDRFRDNLLKNTSFSKKTLEGLGVFKERQNASNAIILEDAFVSVLKSIHQTSGYIGLARPLRSARALLGDNEFRKSVIDIGRNDYIKSLDRYLDQLEGEAINVSNFEALTQELINKLDTGILGLNPFVMLKQPISYMAASTEIDPKFLIKGFRPVASESIVAEISKHSPNLRDRFDGNVTREMGEVAGVGRSRRFFTKKEVMSQKFMEGIRRFDRIAIASIWRSVKLEVAETNPGLATNSNEFFEKVNERSWEVIRRTQPTFHIVDRSTVGANKSLVVRLATKYSSQRNKNWIMIRRASVRYNRSHKTPRDKAKFASAIWVIGVLSPIMLIGVDRLRNVIYDRDDERNFFLGMTSDYINIALGSIYLLGDFAKSIQSKIERGTYAGFDINNPVSSTVNEVNDVVAEGFRTIFQAITDERYKSGRKAGEQKWKTSVKNFATKGIDTAGRIKGINVSTVRKFVGGLLTKIKDLILPSKTLQQEQTEKRLQKSRKKARKK